MRPEITGRHPGTYYGPWNIVLKDFFFPGFFPSPYATITYPQFPSTKDIDTFNPEDDKLDDDDNFTVLVLG
jgi:hypothetical protein